MSLGSLGETREVVATCKVRAPNWPNCPAALVGESQLPWPLSGIEHLSDAQAVRHAKVADSALADSDGPILLPAFERVREGPTSGGGEQLAAARVVRSSELCFSV